MSKAKRGFSLVEILIASSLAAAIATVMVMFLVTSLQAQARTAVRVDLQEQGIMAANRIVKDLQTTVLGGICVRRCTPGNPAYPEILSVQPLIGVGTGDPPSQLYARQWIIYSWAPEQGKILRYLYPPDPDHPAAGGPKMTTTLVPKRIDQDGLLWISQQSPVGVSTLGGDVTAMNITNPAAPPGLTSPITLTISLTKQVKDRPYSYQVERTISPRNSD